MTFWHYTCHHSRDAIGDVGELLPAAQLVAPGVRVPAQGLLVWLTDMPTPNRDALGLTRTLAKCDRTAYRYRVTDDVDVFAWLSVRRSFTFAPDLEAAPGARPRHWFVAVVPVPVIFDPR